MTAIVTDRLVNFASEVDDQTIEQAEQTATMPFVYPHVALMPDAHFGKGSSVGTVIPTDGTVIPAAVGVDIGCGMIAVRTTFDAGSIAGLGLSKLRSSLESAIPMSAGNYNRRLGRYKFTQQRISELEDKARRENVDLSHSPKWREQLGTLGGGNHFIELCLDDRDRVWLFLHSGSRGVGNRIAQKHIRKAQDICAKNSVALPHRDLAYLTEGTEAFDEYIRELRWAQHFALLNRGEMMDRFAQAFARWTRNDIASADDPMALWHADFEVERINTHHNYTRREVYGGREVWLTRKGAIDAHEGVRGLIPGSMGTRSYVVTGKGNPDALCSAPHGAGRRYSRTKARKLFTAADLDKRMKGIEYRPGNDWVDEIPDAYKPIDVVMRDAESMVTIDAELRQILNVKGK
ncbi:RNA-splicing ligase RtcB [Mycolicibacterium pulveris]|uniref:3'-phosphate/5'-hydroxy nucleic acid ligase n=1 Tax=Mycolicibacterium pulveris TaxID=36813 RepID=A0A7I7UKH8_MYCPV|nr:RtcB family protein [Mycolicibacterium pulveris]BBY81885.1 RNA-splicing ligase RtcB [Mycolicibacterium pulveris]